MGRSRRAAPAQSRQRGEFVDVLADASRGMVRDSARAAIPDNAVFDAVDFMLDRPGMVYKRGGSSYFGPAWAAAAAVYAAGVAYAEFPGGPQVVGVTDNGRVQLVTSGTATDKGQLPGSAPGIDTPKLRVDKLILLSATHGAQQAPQKYDGTTLAALGGSPPSGRFLTVYKTRVVIGGNDINRNRSIFSPTPNIEDAWDPANANIDHDFPVTGYASLQNMLLVFGEGRTARLVGDNPPPNTDMSQSTVAFIGCTDARSIALFEGSAIFANPRGVYMTNGGTPQALTDEGLIRSYWQSLFANYDRTTWVISGGLFRSFYLVNVIDNTGTLVAALICHIPTRAWKRYSRNRGLMFASAVGVKDELYVADRSAQRLIALSGFFDPMASNKNDADGTAVTPLLETRLFGRGTGLKHFGRGRITYDMRDAAADNPTLAISVAEGIEAPTFTAITESPLAENLNATRTPSLTIARESQGVTVRVQQTGASAKTELYALEVETRQLPLAAIGPVA